MNAGANMSDERRFQKECLAGRDPEARTRADAGRYVGAAPEEDDGEPFDNKMRRLVACLHDQQSEGARLDGAIATNLKVLGYGT